MRPHLGIASLALIAIGTLGGSIADEDLWRPPVERGGYLVLRGDFHAHTRMSDGFLSPLELPLVARREGLHVVGITEHNWVWPAKIARDFADLVDAGVIVVVGTEITTRAFHLIGLGVDEDIDWRLPITEIVDAIHAQGGVAIAAHPGERFWPAFDRVIDRLDGNEVMHPIAFRGESSSGWRWTDFVAFRDRAAALGHDLAAIGSSDFHFFRALASFTSYVFVETPTAAGVVDAIRAGRTVTYDLTGRAHGDPALAALIEADPLPYLSKERAYASAGPLDAIARTVGWFGLVLALMFGRTIIRRRDPATAPAAPERP